jgi:nucleoside-diphosphate-sugar epimerase
MNILLTGASSFTGYWFIRQLAGRGHTVFATFQGSKDSYSGLRKRRIDELPEGVVRVWNAPMLSTRLQNLVDEVGRWDLLCLHGACVTGYRNPDFDFVHALKNNTEGLLGLLERMAACGMKRVIATGTVYEANEGFGEEPLRAFSPYGLSKSLTWQVQQFCAQNLGLHLGKFVISIPFGPFEESRFTSYLMKTWHEGKVAEIRTPLYIRDHIHVSRLALHFADFAENLKGVAGSSRCAPMGYVESRGAFALRFAAEMRPRLGLDCGVVLGEQKEFSEPFMRVNTQMIDLPEGQWREAEAWDELAANYRPEDVSPNTP